MTSGLPFDDFRNLLANLPGPDEAAVAAVRERDVQLTKQQGPLCKRQSRKQRKIKKLKMCLLKNQFRKQHNY